MPSGAPTSANRSARSASARWGFIPGEPARAAALFGQKFAHFWWFGPTVGTLYPAAWTVAYAAYYLVVLVAAVLGALRLVLGRNRGAIAVAVATLALSVTQTAFYVDGRHRWAVEPVLLVFAAALIDGIVTVRVGPAA